MTKKEGCELALKEKWLRTLKYAAVAVLLAIGIFYLTGFVGVAILMLDDLL